MSERADSGLTQAVKQVAQQHGAMLVGVASVDRFDPLPPVFDAVPAGQHPRDFVPEARAVVSAGCHSPLNQSSCACQPGPKVSSSSGAMRGWRTSGQ